MPPGVRAAWQGIALWRPPLAVAITPINGWHPTLPLAMHCHLPGRYHASSMSIED